jgi:hypothetical protein
LNLSVQMSIILLESQYVQCSHRLPVSKKQKNKEPHICRGSFVLNLPTQVGVLPLDSHVHFNEAYVPPTDVRTPILMVLAQNVGYSRASQDSHCAFIVPHKGPLLQESLIRIFC